MDFTSRHLRKVQLQSKNTQLQVEVNELFVFVEWNVLGIFSIFTTNLDFQQSNTSHIDCNSVTFRCNKVTIRDV